MADKTANQHQAAQDASRFPGLIAHSGTAGTADTSGTAEIVRVGANPTTGALYVQDLAGASGTSNVVLVGGTLNLGTVEVSAQSGGTNVNVVTGTQQTLGTVGVVNSGTLGQVTLVPTVTTVSNLTNGSVRLTVGTLTTGSLTNLASLHTGTIQSVSEVVKGTTTLVSTVTTLSNLTNGSVNILTGTLQSSGTTTGVGVVTSVTNLAAGTVQLNPVPVPTMLMHGTQGTAGGSFFATISAASGAGTKHYISGVDIVMESGTADVRVLTGTAIQGTGVLTAGKFPAGGGIHKQWLPAFATGTNSELTYHFVGAGTAFIHVDYWKGA